MPSPRAAAVLLLLAAAAVAGEAPASLTGVDLRAEHRARRAALAAVLPEDSLALVPAEEADPMGLYAPRQDEDYGWLTGLDDPNGVLLLAPPPAAGKPHGEWLLLPARNPRGEAWIGPRAYPGKETEEALGVAATEDVRKAAEFLGARLKGVKTVCVARTGKTAETARRLLAEALGERKVETRDLRPILGRLRLVKSPEELARIRRAAESTAEGHLRAMERARPGMAEYEVQAILEASCRAAGCRRQAYDSIVGSGPNACVLHYGRNRRILEEGDLVLVDAGGEFLGYACDVTRTWPAGAAFTAEQAAAYDAVLAAQAAGEKAAVAGATFKQIQEAAEKVLKEARLEKGILHGPCHWVGRGVHDPNGQVPLVAGSVFVIEPGVYFPEKGWGIRIEDTYAMRADGTLDCLSAGAPKERKAVEALRTAAVKGSEVERK